MSKKKKKSAKKIQKNIRNIGVILSVVIILVVATLLIYKIANSNRISSVTRKLKNKYDDIKCINKSCDGILAKEEGKKNTDIIRIYNSKGSLVVKYKEKQSKKTKSPYALKDEYFLKKTYISDENVTYSINNLNGEKLYSTKNKLSSLSNYFILMQKQGNIGDVYTLIDKEGKELYSNISELETYDDDKYIYIKIDKDYFILKENGKKILQGYKVVEEVKENDECIYLVIKEDKNDLYYYFDVNDEKIVGDGFNTYKIQKDNTIKVTKKENDEINSYTISTKGKQEKIKENISTSQIIKNFKSKIDSNKYYLYTSSVISDSQKNVLVDDLDGKSFGILNVSTKNYTKIYDYSSEKFYSTVNTLDSLIDDVYVQISCTENSCGSSKMVVYNLSKNEEIFKLEGNEKVAQNYIQFKNGYKVFKYSTLSSDENYKNKYVLYDNKNKELLISTNEINVIDSEIILGEVSNESVSLYLASKNKTLTTENSFADKLNVKDNVYYKYRNDNETIIVDNKGNKIYSTSNGKLEYNDENIFDIESKKVKIYNIKTKEINKYKLLKNESLTDMAGETIEPFRSAIFITNTEDNYIKIVNSKGKVIKKINDMTIKSVEINEKEKRAYIVTKKEVDSKIKFGLYIAK